MNDEGHVVTLTFNHMRHEVPDGLTITAALEYAGYHLVRGIGCGAGFCGACAVIYRIDGHHELRTALACQTVAEDGMDITPILYFPTFKPIYDIGAITQPSSRTLELYPELTACIECNACTRFCPVDIEVMGIVSHLLAGDLANVAELFSNCVMCQLCAASCPVDISPANAALYARRAYAALIAPRSPQLQSRLEEIASGVYEKPLHELMHLDGVALQEAYERREIRIRG